MWTHSNWGEFWIYVKHKTQGKPNTVTGCVLFGEPSGRLYYQEVEINLSYVTMYICDSTQESNTSVEGGNLEKVPPRARHVKLCLYLVPLTNKYEYEITELNMECPSKPWDERVKLGSIEILYDPLMPEKGEFQ
ncbi:hypothetical protein [Paenibacillus pinihumi]|uniref:hypothetical protein n=1 Tax=Paenibacillus pinihumi TaxID=669462 RepID=UPI0004912FFC|nr:hypothetical protein [Paenibacillus pinihumi]